MGVENLKAKQTELESLKSKNVYQKLMTMVNSQYQFAMSWMVKCKIYTKVRLCASWFKEIQKFETDSQTWHSLNGVSAQSISKQPSYNEIISPEML